jgi:hypothetical protein
MRMFSTAVILFVALAACDSSNSAPTAPVFPSGVYNVLRAPAAPPKELMLVTCADCGKGRVYFYDADKVGARPKKSIAIENAFAIGIDDENDLYVSGGGNHRLPVIITELVAAGGKFVYSDDVYDPVNVVPQQGASPPFYVANYREPQELYFPTNGVNSAEAYDDPYLSDIGAIAIDAAGDVYVGGMSTKDKPEIDFIPHGGNAINLKLHVVAQIYALNLDTNGNLVVAESNVGVAVFSPTKRDPILWFDRSTKYDETHPVSVSFGDGGEHIYIMDDDFVRVYDYVTKQSLGVYIIPHSLVCCTAQVTIQPRVPLFDPSTYARAHPRHAYWTDTSPR